MSAIKFVIALTLLYLISSSPIQSISDAYAPSEGQIYSKVMKQYIPENFYPSSFDVRVYNPQCSFTIYEEGLCTGNWAIAIANTLSDLECIELSSDVDLAPQQILDCVHPGPSDPSTCVNITDYTVITDALNYLQSPGLTTEVCYPYSSIFTGNVGARCLDSCTDPSQVMEHYQISTYTEVNATDVDDIMMYLMNNGTAIVSFLLYDDLLHYDGTTVYSHNPQANYIGYHFGKIMGWDTDSSNNQYWIVANSWSPNWGVNGYFNVYANDTCLDKVFMLTL
jgi:hypothetical protein